MATSITPKSELRRNDNVIVGYGEVPGIEIEGKPAWGFPGRKVTFCIDEAKAMARQLDELIRPALQRKPRSLA